MLTLSSLRLFFERQLTLHQRYVARHDLSGVEVLAAARELRWVGSDLAGEVLPEPAKQQGG